MLRDTAPGRLLQHGQHLNVILLRYFAVQGHFQGMHQDHGDILPEQVQLLRAYAKYAVNKRLLVKCAASDCGSVSLVQDIHDKTKIISYLLPADVVTVIDADGGYLDQIFHGHVELSKTT